MTATASRWFRPADTAEFNDDYVALFGQRAPAFTPGSRYAYSNYGMVLLGVLIERVSGQSYYDYVAEHVYAPAGMSRTAWEPESEPVSDRSIGYVRACGAGGWIPNTDMLPYRGTAAGGGYATVRRSLEVRERAVRPRAARRRAHGALAHGQSGCRPERALRLRLRGYPQGRRPRRRPQRRRAGHERRLAHLSGLEEALPSLDALYVTRMQTEWDTAGESSRVDLSRFSVGTRELSLLKRDAIIMHPLPRGPEIDPAVDQDPRAMYWRQERNGMWMRVAVLIKIFAVEDQIAAIGS